MAIHCPASMEMHYVQWILLNSVYEDTSKIQDTIGTLFIQGPSFALLVWRSIMFNGSFLRVCRILQFVKKLDFAFLSLGGPSHGWTKPWCPGLVSRPSAKAQEALARSRGQWQEVEGLLFSPQKLSVGAYFELLFLGCGFLIHLSNRSDSPRFRDPWKKICQKFGTQQEPHLFKVHPLSYQYGVALCSMVHF